MALPETIAVRYTEDEAGYVSIRPVVKQTFRADELVDMVLMVTGKETERMQKILKAGTAVYNGFRYWWTGIEATAEELGALLGKYPDAEPGRAFRAEDCTAVMLASGGSPARYTIELRREDAGRRRLLRQKSLWDSVMKLAKGKEPGYLEYSYVRRTDVYALSVTTEEMAALAQEAQRLATREVKAQLGMLGKMMRVVFYCPR